MHERQIRRRLKKRVGARGAAMIEAVIVVSTMLVFLGLIVWTRNSYGMKLDLQQTTRSNVLFYASHGCEGAGGSSQVGGTVDASGEDALKAAQKTDLPDKAAANRSFNTASASASGVSSWQAIWNGGGNAMNLQKHGLSRTINATSKVVCNEKTYSSPWTAWFQFGIDFVNRGIGGARDLFR
ncbi:MAG TPA: hypothetical protein VM580_33340 [Labilithrix sp.]|jgi:hypothetical protein|nr:hypothetical protein [Labilithrix sp.]